MSGAASNEGNPLSTAISTSPGPAAPASNPTAIQAAEQSPAAHLPTSTTTSPSDAQRTIHPESALTESRPTETTLATSEPADSSVTAAPPSSTNDREGATGTGMSPYDMEASLEADGAAAVHIALLLTSSKRHPYKIDKKYLSKRGVHLDDPWDLPVSTLKELILRDWREDWEDAPASAASIRLISMGIELQDGEVLKDKRFNRSGTNIVHMVIKREIPDEEEMKGGADTTSSGRGRGRAQNERNGPCCCVVM